MIDGRMLRVEGLLRVCNSCLHTVHTTEQSPRHYASTITAANSQLDRSGDDFMNASLMRADLPQADSPVYRRSSLRSFASWEIGPSSSNVVECSPQHISTGLLLYGAEEEQLLAIDKVYCLLP